MRNTPPPRPRAARVAALLGACLLAGCQDTAQHSARPLVLVSVPPQAWFVARLAGARVETVVLVPPGASPALLEPGLPQLRAASRAALWIKVGHPHFPFERTWLDQLMAQNPELALVDASAHAERHDGDPHVWLAPRHARAMSQEIERALSELLPEHRAELQENGRRLRADIDALDRELRARFEPLRGREFFVFHPAWGYFAEEYGLVQVAIEAHGKEPDAQRLARLIQRAREGGVRTIFVQPQLDPQSAQVLALEIGARVEPLDPLAYDWLANLRKCAARLSEALA